MIVMETMGERLADAGINTLMCLIVCFFALIFISFIISLFKYINTAQNAIADRKAAKKEDETLASDAVNNTISQIEAKEEEELTDDLELVAVISAAVAANAGTSADGFVVKSIRKIKR